jgi:hypothetical protein
MTSGRFLAHSGILAEKEDEICLQTRAKTPIRNVQDRILPPERVRAGIDGAAKAFKGTSKIVNGPSGYYNCMGLVFASRRTQIEDLDRIPEILREDGYVEVHAERDATVGDVVVYSIEGRFTHVALVVESSSGPLWVPRILSKHGWSVEVVHYVHEGPYSEGKRQYFRLRNYDIA